MSRRIVHHQAGKPLAIRIDANTVLSVPPMHPQTPRDIRVRVFEMVLRRQYGFAHQIAEDCNYDIERRNSHDRARRRDEVAAARRRRAVTAAQHDDIALAA